MSTPSNPAADSVIRAEELRVVYPAGRAGDPDTVAVAGVSFDVQRGEIFGFLGPNGAGKTTTISALTTLLSPSAGRATIEGVDTVAGASEVRRRIGLVFQTSTADGQLTGRENLILEAGLYGLAPSEVSARIEVLLRQVELGGVADRLVSTYSGGMRRRLELAAGLVHGPRTIFLDEPTLGLDPQGRAGFWRYIRELRASGGITVFLTTHYLDEADQLCDRIAIIDHGRIIAIGTPAELKDRMGGDTLDLTVGRGDADLSPALRVVPGVSAVTREGATYHLRCARGESLVGKVVLTAQNAGVEVEGLSVRKPSLDEVFLSLTGHAYREEGSNGPIPGTAVAAPHDAPPRTKPNEPAGGA